MPLPDWLFKSIESKPQTSGSTMAGTFSTRNLLKGENAFAAQIPSGTTREPEKKRVIITDFSLPFESGEKLLFILSAINTLLEEGFSVYIIRSQGRTCFIQLSGDPSECNLRHEIEGLLPITADEALKFDPAYSADGTVLLDYAKSRELAEAVMGIDLEFTTSELLDSKQFVDRLQTLVFPFYEQYGVSLHGHAVPDLILDKHVLDFLHFKISEILYAAPEMTEIQNILHWGFRFIINDVETLKRCLADPHFPKDKIFGMSISSESEMNAFMEMDRVLFDVKKVWFYGDQNQFFNGPNNYFPNVREVSANLVSNALDFNPESQAQNGAPEANAQVGSPARPCESSDRHVHSPYQLLTVPNKIWEIQLLGDDYVEFERFLDGSDTPDPASGMSHSQLMRGLETHCRAIYFRGNCLSLNAYLTATGGVGLRTVALLFNETTPLVEDIDDIEAIDDRLSINKLILTLESIPSDVEIEKIIKCFPVLNELVIDCNPNLVMSDPQKYFDMLVSISRLCCEREYTEDYKHGLPIIQAIERRMREFDLMIDAQQYPELKEEIAKFRKEDIYYPLGDDEDDADREIAQDNDIYDGHEPSGPLTQLHQMQNQTTFKMVKVCERLEGGKAYSAIRRRKFYYDFSWGPSVNPVKTYVKPLFAETLPEVNNLKPTHKLYSKGRFEWNAQYQCFCHQLPGLTQFDRICDWNLIQGTGNFSLRYSTSDNFYYMTSKADPGPGVEFSFRLHDPDCQDNTKYEADAAPYRKEFKKEDRANPVYTLEDVRAHAEYYNCGQRTAGFLYEHRANPTRFYGMESWTHEWIEHETGTLNLGGRPSNLVYENKPAPVTRISDDHIPFQPPITLHTVQEFAARLALKGTNTLLLFDTEDALELAREEIIKAYRDSVVVVNKPSDLKASVPYLSVNGNTPGMGPLPGGWIVNQVNWLGHDILLVDWSNFTGRQLPQNNSCIGKISQRKIEHYPLAERFHVIGLALTNSAAAKDRSHVSRHKGNVFHVARSAIPVNESNPIAQQSDLIIDLHGSPQWFELLLGRIEIEDGQFKGYIGALISKKFSKVTIKNPPANCQEFERFVTHLRNGTFFQYFDRSYRFETPIEVEILEGYDFQKYMGLIGFIHENLVDSELHRHRIDQQITPSTFDRLLHDTYIDENAVLRKSPGWIAKGDRHFYVTRTLPNHQLCALLDHLLAFPEPRPKIHFYCAPGVEIPHELKSNATCIMHDYSDFSSDDGDDSVGTQLDLYFDVSGRSPDDFLYGNKVTERFGGYAFEEQQSDVWKALIQGKNICLTGNFSDEMIDHFSTLLLPRPYLWHQHQKVYVTGRVTLCPDHLLPVLSWVRSPGRIVSMNGGANNPLAVRLNPGDNRKQAIDSIFKHQTHQPAVLVLGAPGIGKSCSVRALINDHQDEYKVFSENQIIAWAMDKKFEGKYSVLVIDESTIRGTDWSVFLGLYANPPHLLINNKIYFLQPHQRVIFLGNETREMPSLFNKVAKITFPAMTREEVIAQILRPILADQAAKFYEDRPNKPVRALHAEAIAQCARANPLHSRFSSSFGTFDLTPSRLPIVQSIVTCLNARHFRTTARHDAARFGGQSGIWIEGPAGIGKTELITATLNALGYMQGKDYLVLPANMDSKAMRVKIAEAFDNGMIVVIDELDTALDLEMIAEINSFLMGENLNYERPKKPGFTLMATGNGPSYDGRMALPESLKSRLHCHQLGQYPEAEARQILMKQFQPMLAAQPDFAWTIEGHLKYHLTYPTQFTFREACEWLEDGGDPRLPKRAPKPIVPVPQATAALQTSAYQAPAANLQLPQQPTKTAVDLVI